MFTDSELMMIDHRFNTAKKDLKIAQKDYARSLTELKPPTIFMGDLSTAQKQIEWRKALPIQLNIAKTLSQWKTDLTHRKTLASQKRKYQAELKILQKMPNETTQATLLHTDPAFKMRIELPHSHDKFTFKTPRNSAELALINNILQAFWLDRCAQIIVLRSETCHRTALAQMPTLIYQKKLSSPKTQSFPISSDRKVDAIYSNKSGQSLIFSPLRSQPNTLSGAQAMRSTSVSSPAKPSILKAAVPTCKKSGPKGSVSFNI